MMGGEPNNCPGNSKSLKADHQLFPNLSLSYNVWAAVRSTLTDVVSATDNIPILAGSGVTYNGYSMVFDGSENAWMNFGSAVSSESSAFSVSVRVEYASFAPPFFLPGS